MIEEYSHGAKLLKLSLIPFLYHIITGSLDVLVNNAGRLQRAEFIASDVEVEKDLFNVNVFGITNICRVAVKHWLVYIMRTVY